MSILKLDATHEAASFRELTRGGVRLHVLKKLLPSPEDLQKGFSWPDPRGESDAIIRDRNPEAAQYFLNAYEISLAPKAIDTEKALMKAVARLPPPQVAEAYQYVATRSGSADAVVADVKAQYPDLDDSDIPVGRDGTAAGVIRPNKISAQKLFLRADGFELRVPPGLIDRVQVGPEGDGWLTGHTSAGRIRVRTNSEPQWPTTTIPAFLGHFRETKGGLVIDMGKASEDRGKLVADDVRSPTRSCRRGIPARRQESRRALSLSGLRDVVLRDCVSQRWGSECSDDDALLAHREAFQEPRYVKYPRRSTTHNCESDTPEDAFYVYHQQLCRRCGNAIRV